MEIKQFYPLFEEGRILKKDALDMIRDYAPDFFSLLFHKRPASSIQHIGLLLLML